MRYLMYAVKQLPVVARHVVRDLPRAQHLKETARSNFRSFLVDKRRLHTDKARIFFKIFFRFLQIF